MIEIIPNWHPVVVHFTVALISISALLYFFGYFLKEHKLGEELLITARWCLWLGIIMAITTVIAGFLAYYSVAHDTPSHEAMTVHRNWAIATLIVIVLIACWSLWLHAENRAVPFIFVIGMLIAFSLVSITAWYGAELVYRHGIGVMSLPKNKHSCQTQDNGKKQTKSHEHDHSHAH